MRQPLAEAQRRFNAEGGILLYLRQEGRGIGLYNKLSAYALQDEGQDTFAANRSLGLREDARNYEAAAQMLLALGASRIRLVTNNPDKCTQLRTYGIEIVEVLPTGVYAKEANRAYLLAKAVHTQHTIPLKLVESSEPA